MKKYLYLFSILIPLLLSGCSVNYDSYYKKYGNVINKDDRLNSVKIDETITNYPNDNMELLDKYDLVYGEVSSEYKVYSTYYSSLYDTIYISYDRKSAPVQTIKSKELALMEEHLLNYFKMDDNKELYKNYLKVVRIYPDYASSACRKSSESEDEYSQIEGCANYNALEASININGLVNIDRFFKPYKYIEDNIEYTVEPKRDTFAHEFGHIATYYHMILKGDGSYQNYLRLRLKEQYDIIYKEGLPNYYSSNDGYYVQPVEILADDYVELYYDTSKKSYNDYYEYELQYDDLRNSLTDVSKVSKFLKDDLELFNEMKEYYDIYLNKEYMEYDTKKVVSFSGNVFVSIHDVLDSRIKKNLLDKELIVLGEVTIGSEKYYRVILSNVSFSINIRQEYNNIGYVLASECIDIDKDTLYFNYYEKPLTTDLYLPIEDKNIFLFPFYDFSYFIYDENYIKLYNYLDNDFEDLYLSPDNFIN